MKRITVAVLCFFVLVGITACGKAGGNGGSDSLLTIDDGKITIVEIKGTDGLFVEKGEKAEAKNITSIVVKNNSDKMLEYGRFSFRVNQFERAEFSVSALGAGETALVQESLARPFSESDEFEIDTSATLTAYTEAVTDSKDVEVTTEPNKITLRNVSDKTLSVNVIYKYFEDGMYYGGIAFSAGFEKIGPGENVSKVSENYGENCRIVNLIIE